MALSLCVVYHSLTRLTRLLLSNSVVGTTVLDKNDLVLVTGGSSGLGAALVRRLSRVNTVVVLDVNIPQHAALSDNVHYYKCDTSQRDQVEQCASLIQKNHGTVTCLINNAGIVYGKPLLQLNYEQIDEILRVNLYSNFITIKTFLPGMILARKGYIVSISSVLGYISPAKLSAYGASKAGLVALHESLTYELGPPSTSATGVKTLLVSPGQMETELFGSVTTPSKFLAPVLKPDRVADEIIAAMHQGRVGELRMPFYTNIIPVVRALPWQFAEFIRTIAGIDRAL